MFISVVILTHNHALLLKDCLESLLKQDFLKTRFEIIVVDDGSTDNTSFVVKNFNVRYFYQKHSGVSVARNNGLRKAKGDIICFIADDYELPYNYLKTIDHFFKKNKYFDVLSFTIVAKTKSFWSQINDLHYKTRLKGTLNTVHNKYLKFFIHRYQTDNFFPAEGAAAYRRRIFSKIGFFDESLLCLEDLDFAIRLGINDFKHYKSDVKVFRSNNASLYYSLKSHFFKGKAFFPLKKKWGSRFKPFLKTNFVGVLTVFFATPFLSLIRLVKLPFFKRIIVFIFMLAYDY
ncbi:MAG: glycosyltransferase, partial [Nanoarchaeota archaeon]|nr:glycosyltransferase [Nanoarchaeota archaeon]